MQPPHDDPLDDAKRNVLQSLSILSTLGEAAARLAAVSIQSNIAKEKKAAGREHEAVAAQQKADQLAAQARDERRLLADRLDGTWISKATLYEIAVIWRTATVHAATGDPVAQKVAGLALDRLGQLHPQWRKAYDRARAAGHSAPDAARAAAYEVWEAEARMRGSRWAARPHGGDPDRVGLRAGANGRALPAGGQALHDLDKAVREEAASILHHVSPEALDRLQRELRAQGMAPAADGLGLARQAVAAMVESRSVPPAVGEAMARHVEAYAARERVTATTAAGTADNPRTEVDEHADGQVISARSHGSADFDSATADQRRRWGSTFPRLTVSGKAQSAVAVPQQAPARRQTQGAGR